MITDKEVQRLAFDGFPLSHTAPGFAPKKILEEANELINGQRQSDYGSVTENLGNIAALFSMILKHPVTPAQAILCMEAVKFARLCNTPNHRDSWVDVAGYVGVYDKLMRGE